MNVVSGETWILRLPFVRESRDTEDAHHEIVGVTLHSDTGETGLGFTWCADYPAGSSVKALLDDFLIPRVVGQSALDVSKVWHDLRAVTHRLGYGISSFGIAAIDIALWDLKSRSNGHSLARELGQVVSSVPAYGSGKGSPTLSLDELVELSAGYVEQGFDAVKIRVGLSPANDVKRVARLRAELGDDVKIMCDANERLDVATALWLGRRLADFGIYWFEEPVRSDDVEAHVRLAQALPMPIAAGEHLCGIPEFVSYLNAGALDVLQPNVCMVGGITEIMRIGHLAAAHGRAFAPHVFSEFHVHVAAALPRTTSYVEYFPWIDAYVEEPLQVKGGELVVPDGPGHGLRFTDNTWDRYRIA
ncbi:mandelate racemase/muconate lactonizing enzyme family protein [Blastococcus brunescens]|uniref:Mandelate racemase/muconate lactonizing enzyme family protein n=1 Tax=Blastococcus brunescens TaxID=1564165 RepID=A0ABZ1B5J5_9ACTN|nr:mandelate racemase/muconate lactonizing enzyme family protein [Blastococcus sp. BMG 8361]WRL65103.1 mandelate racemase/muconate lactonizing enzyme family protein [Blastococcus sp. BMG 8361]